MGENQCQSLFSHYLIPSLSNMEKALFWSYLSHHFSHYPFKAIFVKKSKQKWWIINFFSSNQIKGPFSHHLTQYSSNMAKSRILTWLTSESHQTETSFASYRYHVESFFALLSFLPKLRFCSHLQLPGNFDLQLILEWETINERLVLASSHPKFFKHGKEWG